jgi:hypothetical protein
MSGYIAGLNHSLRAGSFIIVTSIKLPSSINLIHQP